MSDKKSRKEKRKVKIGSSPESENANIAITPLGQAINLDTATDKDWESLEFDHQYQREDFEYVYRHGGKLD